MFISPSLLAVLIVLHIVIARGEFTALTAREGSLRSKVEVDREIYTTNIACIENNCVNPIIPGMYSFGKNVLEEHKNMTWICANRQDTPTLYRLGGFCSRVIAAYPFAIPQPAPYSKSESEVIAEQAYKALQTYIVHVSGMGYDYWDFSEPWNFETMEDECMKQVWEMACYTFFPRCNKIQAGEYLPPCRSTCERYLEACQVECCDESVKCKFTHAKKMADGTTVYEHGYPNHNGPSPFCTSSTIVADRPRVSVLYWLATASVGMALLLVALLVATRKLYAEVPEVKM